MQPDSVSVQSANYVHSVSVHSANSVRDSDNESSSPEMETPVSIATSDLKAIAECMINSGYGKECGSIYRKIRKSTVDEGLHKLGIQRLKSSHIQKLDKVALELRINNWLIAIKTAVMTLFNGERKLCDHIFSSSDSIRELCFAEITKEGAINVFKFAELVSKRKGSINMIFQLMEMYETISELWPETESTFSFESTTAVREQALSSLMKLGESVRTILSEFESSIQNDSSKIPVPGGGIHSLALSSISYISTLADYSSVLSDIIADWPVPVKSPLPVSYFDSPTSPEAPATAVSARIAWLVLVLLCKLDTKAGLYKDVSLSYLFLANNLNFMVEKVRTSRLIHLLGDDWVDNHRKKVKQFASNYETTAWYEVLSSLPEDNNSLAPEEARECLRRFNMAFADENKKQRSWVVPDGNLRDEMKLSIAGKVMNAYTKFYESNELMLNGEVGITADDLGNYLSDLFHGVSVSGSSNSLYSMSSSSSSHKQF